MNNDISVFWKALVDSGVSKSERQWTLTANVPWIGGVNTFYNRECYDDLCIRMATTKRVLVKGTPGIGKTMFLQRLLVDIVEKCKEGGVTTFPTIDYIRREENVVVKYRLLSDGAVKFGDHNDVDYYLSDSVDIEVPKGKILTIEVASVKEINYNTFDKRVAEAGEDGMVAMMPLCLFDELKAMNPLMSAEEYQFRFEVFGGSARNFGRTVRVDVALSITPVPLVDVTMLWYFGDKHKQQFPHIWSAVEATLAHEFTKPGKKNNVINSLMRHVNDRLELIWASKFMEILGCKILDGHETSLYGELEKLMGPSGMGAVFEGITHVKLTSSDTPFDLVPLHPKGAKNVSRDSVLFDLKKPVVKRLKGVEDISSLPLGSYGLPIFSNFPLVDAIIQPNVLLQMTISTCKHKGAIERLSDIRAELTEKEQSEHMMVFVVPRKNMKTFQYQSDLAGIRQFLMCPEFVSTRKRSPSSEDARGLVKKAKER